MEKKTTRYIKGGARAFKSGDIAVDILFSDVESLVNDKGYLKIIISQRREPDQYGNTHSIKLNDYQPKDSQGGSKKAAASSKPAPKQPAKLAKPNYDQSDDLDKLPF